MGREVPEQLYLRVHGVADLADPSAQHQNEFVGER